MRVIMREVPILSICAYENDCNLQKSRSLSSAAVPTAAFAAKYCAVSAKKSPSAPKATSTRQARNR